MNCLPLAPHIVGGKFGFDVFFVTKRISVKRQLVLCGKIRF